MPKRLSLLLVAVLAMGLIAAGCGDDDEPTTTTTTTEAAATGASGASGTSGPKNVSPERAELIQQADEICGESDDEIEAAAEERFGDTKKEPPVAEQEAFISETVVPNIQGQLDQLRELDPPEEDAEQWNGLLDDLEQAIGEVEADPSAVTGGEDGPFEDVNRQAAEFGLKVCGQG